MDSDTELIELSNSEESESEEESEKKEKEQKNRVRFFTTKNPSFLFKLMNLGSKKYISIHHPDISTPPPKL